jgi:hypothetical protein
MSTTHALLLIIIGILLAGFGFLVPVLWVVAGIIGIVIAIRLLVYVAGLFGELFTALGALLDFIFGRPVAALGRVLEGRKALATAIIIFFFTLLMLPRIIQTNELGMFAALAVFIGFFVMVHVIGRRDDREAKRLALAQREGMDVDSEKQP